VGYCGGEKPFPTYRSIGDHTETTQIEFDPKVVTYEALLSEFLEGHDPRPRRSTQYASIIFPHNPAQREAAERALAAFAASNGGARPSTIIKPVSVFYSAEHYHHKYYLQQSSPALVAALCAAEGLGDPKAMPVDAFADSHLLTVFNGFAGDYGPRRYREEMFASVADKLSPELVSALRRVCKL